MRLAANRASRHVVLHMCGSAVVMLSPGSHVAASVERRVALCCVCVVFTQRRRRGGWREAFLPARPHSGAGDVRFRAVCQVTGARQRLPADTHRTHARASMPSGTGLSRADACSYTRPVPGGSRAQVARPRLQVRSPKAQAQLAGACTCTVQPARQACRRTPHRCCFHRLPHDGRAAAAAAAARHARPLCMLVQELRRPVRKNVRAVQVSVDGRGV